MFWANQTDLIPAYQLPEALDYNGNEIFKRIEPESALPYVKLDNGWLVFSL